MEIRRALRGEQTGFAPAGPAKREEKKTKTFTRPSTDRVELSRQWLENMEEQRTRLQAAMLTGGREEKNSNGILDMLDGASAEEEELDAMSKALDTQMKCLKIAMRIMQGKKVPPEDERYLMENDPEGYKLAISMRGMVKEDDEECESVLDDEDKGEKKEPGASDAPSESGDAVSSEE